MKNNNAKFKMLIARRVPQQTFIFRALRGKKARKTSSAQVQGGGICLSNSDYIF